MQRQFDCLVLRLKKGLVQDAIFIHSGPGHAKADKPRESEARTRKSRDGTRLKNSENSHSGYKPHSIIDRNYELNRRFKTTTVSLHDSYVNLSEKE